MATYTPIRTTGQYNVQPAAAPPTSASFIPQPSYTGQGPSFLSRLTAALPGAAASSASDVVGAIMAGNVASAQSKAQAKLALENTKLQGVEFDKRYGWTNEGNKAIGELSDRQFTEGNALEDEVFKHIMQNDQSGFDENLGIGKQAFDDQQTALSGLMTAQKAARLQMLGASQAEEARQRAIQDQADGLSSALPEQIGFNAQEAGRADAGARRTAFTAANTSGPDAAPAFAADPALAAAFARSTQRGATEAKTDADNSSSLAAYGDAFNGSERRLADFAGAIDRLTNKAAISRSALPAELEVGAVKKANAGDAYDFTSKLIADQANQRQGAATTYHGAIGSAEQKRGQDLATVLANYFGDSMAGRSALTSGLVGASQDYANTRNQLFSSKIAGTTSSSGPLISILRNAAATVAKVAGG